MQQVWGELGNGKKAKKIVHVKKVLRMLHVSDMVCVCLTNPNTDCQYKNQIYGVFNKRVTQHGLSIQESNNHIPSSVRVVCSVGPKFGVLAYISDLE